jgi:hypothetical protein
MFEGVCPYAGMSIMQRLRHLTKCMISEAVAAPGTRKSFAKVQFLARMTLESLEFQVWEGWQKTNPPQ